ncbi:MAG: hypothetical protein D6722_13215 [Bacteroidetes bacterium]|nr:MAG: hypothetical protein D6722_13215 [Bacteroidota bacterium]
MLAPGATLQEGKYTIIQILGQGGFGITYLAHQREVDRRVVLKAFRADDKSGHVNQGSGSQWVSGDSGFLHPGGNDPRKQIASLLKEARLSSQVVHPNFVRIYDFFEEDGEEYILMEYVAGETLREHAQNPIPFQTALRWIDQVASAMEQFHAKGIIHRDIKPGNIMIREDEKDAVLIDMGIAITVTRSGDSYFVGAGTERYAAPEQNDPTLGSQPQVDVYGLGATLYHALSGALPPHHGEILNNELRPLGDGIPQVVFQLVRKAMAIRQQDRFASMTAFRKAIEAILSPVVEPDTPDQQDPPEPPTEVVPATVPRQWGWIWGLGISMIVFAVGGILWKQGVFDVRTEEPTLQNEPPRPSGLRPAEGEQPPEAPPRPATESLTSPSVTDFESEPFARGRSFRQRQAWLDKHLRETFSGEDAQVVTAVVRGADTIVTEVKDLRVFFEGLMIVEGARVRTLSTETNAAGKISVWMVEVDVPNP